MCSCAAAHTAKALSAPRNRYSDAVSADVSAAERKRAESGCVACSETVRGSGQAQALAAARTALGFASRALALATPLRVCRARQAAHVLYRAGQCAVRLHAYPRRAGQPAERRKQRLRFRSSCSGVRSSTTSWPSAVTSASAAAFNGKCVRCATGRLLSCWTAAECAVPLPLQRP